MYVAKYAINRSNITTEWFVHYASDYSNDSPVCGVAWIETAPSYRNTRYADDTRYQFDNTPQGWHDASMRALSIFNYIKQHNNFDSLLTHFNLEEV